MISLFGDTIGATMPGWAITFLILPAILFVAEVANAYHNNRHRVAVQKPEQAKNDTSAIR